MPSQRKVTGATSGRQRAVKPRKSTSKPRTNKRRAPVHLSDKDYIDGDRERWLTLARDLMRPLVIEGASWHKVPLQNYMPPTVSCSWPPGRASRLLSSTVINGATERPQITISPSIGKGWALWDKEHAWEDHSLAAICHLLHELVHLAVGEDCGHKGDFAKVAEGLGFISPLPDARPGEFLLSRLEPILKRLGEFPNISLKPDAHDAPGARKQRNRQRKYVCSHCGRIIRAAGPDLKAIHHCDDGESGTFVSAEK